LVSCCRSYVLRAFAVPFPLLPHNRAIDLLARHIGTYALRYLPFLGNQSTSGLDREYFTFFWFPVELPVFIMGMLSYSVWKQYVKGRSVGAQAARRISLMLLGVSCILIRCRTAEQ
jgi:hypothetical protein